MYTVQEVSEIDYFLYKQTDDKKRIKKLDSLMPNASDHYSLLFVIDWKLETTKTKQTCQQQQK